MRSDFADIYRTNRWSGHETRSGPGSSFAATALLSSWLTKIAERHELHSVCDVGCGEGRWMPELPRYVGVDIVPDAIRKARKIHPDREFLILDAAQDPLPECELFFTRDCLQHLSVVEGTMVLSNIMKSRPRWLIASSYWNGENLDPPSAYDAYRVNLQSPPFNFPTPHELLLDGYDEHGQIRDPNKYVGLWAL